MSGLGRFRKGCAAAAACYCADTGSPERGALKPKPSWNTQGDRGRLVLRRVSDEVLRWTKCGMY